MAAVVIAVNTVLAQKKLERLSAAVGARAILKVVGLRLESYVDESFKTHGRGQWPALAPSTIEQRRRASSEPLQNEGRYKASFVKETDERTFVEVGSNLKTPDGRSLPAIHEHGVGPYEIHARRARVLAARLPGGAWKIFGTHVNHPGIPARPVLPDQSTAERLVVETVSEMLDMATKDVA